ncbi:MAG: DUF418 domain-containing protein [Oleiphilaceae bacterium]|nr:DUF418 domain-containing protein [Oleiphilaceae bacterium]
MPPSDAPHRYQSLDVLRGFALLGILVMNIQAFAMVAAAYVNPTLAGPFEGVDFALWLVSHVLAEYKFLSLFAALFGAGIVMMARSSEAAGVDPWLRHRRRMVLLGLIGLLHATFIWYGDILFLYAVVGLVAFRFREMPVATLLRWALALYLVPLMAGLLFTLALMDMPADEYQQLVRDMWAPGAAALQEEISAYRGRYWQQLGQRVETLMGGYLLMILLEEGWRTLALMLAGMAAYRSGLITGEWPLRRYRHLALACFALGVPVILLGVAFNQSHGWEMRFAVYLGRAFNGLAAPLVALGWACAVLTAWRRGYWPSLMARLSALGRMALTGYLLTSVLCTSVFYGFGLGLFERLERPGQWLVMVAVWALLLFLAPLWLRHFRQGPVEWLWRRGVYGRSV